MYIGHIPGTGALALAGVGVCGPIVTLLSSFGTLVGLGGSILLGIRMGEGNLPKARQILSNSFLVLCGFSVILTTGFLFMKDHLLIWFGASEITFPYADTYMTIYTAGTFFALMAAGLNYFINCQGFPVAGMMTVLIGAVSNIILLRFPLLLRCIFFRIPGSNGLPLPVYRSWSQQSQNWKDLLSYIFCIQLYYFFKVSDIASAADLPHSGNSRFHGDSCSVMIFILFILGF